MPVEVVRYEQVPIDASLLRDCPGSNIEDIETNADLLDAYLQEREGREQCNADKAAIREQVNE